MSASIRPDPAGGKLWLQIDGVDVLELTPSALKVDGDELAKLTGATFTGAVGLPNDGFEASGNNPRIKFRETDETDLNTWLVQHLGTFHFQHRADSGSFLGTPFKVGLDPYDIRVDDDPVAERGSDGNGEYVRFYDGTQICWGVQAVTLSGGATAEALSPVDFPAAFSSAPSGRGTISQLSNEIGGREHVAYHYQGYPKTTSIRFGVIPAAGNTTTNANDLEIDWEAIGRWK